MTELEEARKIFSEDRFATATTGIEILEVGEKYAKCALKTGPEHKNAADTVMGGAIFTLADLTFAVASNFRQGHTVGVVSQISFLSAPKYGTTLYAESRLIRDGRRACFYEINITNGEGKPVALVTMNGMHVEDRGH
ncbi:MAG: PaaI family thioesterase [Clostridia bacterium]|nr:PaaI family thioesterase [Clostridia bacterium]